MFFTPEMLNGRPVHIVGAGSLGSKLCQNLVRKGVPEIHVWDDDVLEGRNLFNQAYFAAHVGVAKVTALLDIAHAIRRDVRIIPHRERVTKTTQLAGIVFSAVDLNRERYQSIWPCVRMNSRVTFYGDGRVGLDGGKAYGLDPNNEWHCERYENPEFLHNHPDPEDVLQGCKTEFSLPENSDRVVAEMMWRFTKWLALERGSDALYVNCRAWSYAPESEVFEAWDANTE